MLPLNAELNAALLSCGMAFFSWELATDKVYGDVTLAELFDVEAGAMATGVPILSLVERISINDRARVAASVHRAITGGHLYQERYHIDHSQRGAVDVVAIGRCLKDDTGVPFIYNGAVMEVSGAATASMVDPLPGHCQSALDLAQKRGNELAARYLSSALKVIGAG